MVDEGESHRSRRDIDRHPLNTDRVIQPDGGTVEQAGDHDRCPGCGSTAAANKGKWCPMCGRLFQ